MSIAEQIVMEVLTGGKPVVRLMLQRDVIPAEFEVGFDQLGRLDHNWIWVVERYGKIEGCIVAAPCHGVAFVYRVAMAKDAPKYCLRKLIRQAVNDCRERGIRGMMTFVNPDNETQMKLKKLMENWGGGSPVPLQMVMAAPLPGRV